MGRSPCCSNEGLNRGSWTAQEDKILTSYIKVHGEGQWRNLPKRAGLKRCGKSCRLRWLNYLRPDIKRGNISHDEEELILRLHSLLGNRWSLIAGRLPGRTDNEIKNYWNTILGKKANSSQSPPPPKATHKSPSRAAKEIEAPRSLPTKATRPQVIRARATKCTGFVPIINSNPPPITQNFDLRHNEINTINYFRDSELPTFQCDIYQDDRIDTANYLSDIGFFDFENNGDDPFPASNCLSMEDFFVEGCIGNINGEGEDEIHKNPLDLESIENFLNTEQWP